MIITLISYLLCDCSNQHKSHLYHHHHESKLASVSSVHCRVTLIVPACQPGWWLEGNGEFERKFEEFLEEIIQSEVRLGGSPTINVPMAV